MVAQPPTLLARYRQLAPAAAVRVSPLCLGTMTFGNKHPDKYGECSNETAFEILDLFYKSGGNFLDTANAYQDEASEILLGEWMASRKNRDQLVLATKYSSGYKSHDESLLQPNYGGNNSKSMRVSLEASLAKLQTSYIDLFYVHWWDYSTSIPELMQSLNDLVTSGKVLYLGISDTPAWVVAKANQYARDHGLRQFSVYQGMWNAAMRDFEREIIPMARDEGMALCPYGTLNQGRFQTEEGFKEREKGHNGRKFIPTSDLDKSVSKVLEKISKAKGCALTGVALAYCIQKTPYVFPIVGGRKVEHIQGSIDALSLWLTKEDIDEIESAYDFKPGFPHDFLSGSLFGVPDAASGAYHPQDVLHTNIISTFDWVAPPQAIKPPADQSK